MHCTQKLTQCLCPVVYSRHGCEIFIQLLEPFSAFTTSLTISALDSATFVSRTVMSRRIVVMSHEVFDRCMEIVIRLLPGHVGCLRVELRVHLWNSDHFLNHLDRNVPLLDRRYVHHSVSLLHLRYLPSLLGRVQHRNLPLDHDGDVNNFVDELQLRHLDGFLLNPRSCLDRRCHNVDQAVCSLAVLTFQREGLVLASNVPDDGT